MCCSLFTIQFRLIVVNCPPDSFAARCSINGQLEGSVNGASENWRPAPQLHPAAGCNARRVTPLMKVCKHESSRMLSGKQEGTLDESLCAQAVSSTAHFTRLLFYSKSRRCRHITVNLKLEAGASESSPPSQSESQARPLSQSESPARPMPDSDASTSEIFMSWLPRPFVARGRCRGPAAAREEALDATHEDVER